MAALREIAANYSVSGLGSAARDVRGFNRRADRSVTRLNRVKRGFRSAGRIAKRFGVAIGAIGFAAFVGGAYKAVSTAKELGFALAQVRAQGGLTKEQLVSVKDAARRLGRKTLWSAKQAVTGFLELSKAGYNVEQSMASAQEVMDLATAANINLGSSAALTTDILKSYGLKAEQSQRVVDVMAQGARNASTDVTELGTALSYTGGTAHNMGLSLEKTVTLLDLLANKGVKGSRAGTSLRASFSRFARIKAGDTTERMNRAFERMGPAVQQATREVEAGQMGFVEFLEVLANNEAQMEDLIPIFGQRAADSMARLMGALAGTNDEYDKYLKKMRESEGTARDVASIMENTLEGAYRRVKASVTDLMWSFGDKASKPIQDFLDNRITPLINDLSAVVQNSDSVAEALSGINDKLQEEGVYKEMGKVGKNLVTATGKGILKGWNKLPMLVRSLLGMWIGGKALAMFGPEAAAVGAITGGTVAGASPYLTGGPQKVGQVKQAKETAINFQGEYNAAMNALSSFATAAENKYQNVTPLEERRMTGGELLSKKERLVTLSPAVSAKKRLDITLEALGMEKEAITTDMSSEEIISKAKDYLASEYSAASVVEELDDYLGNQTKENKKELDRALEKTGMPEQAINIDMSNMQFTVEAIEYLKEKYGMNLEELKRELESDISGVVEERIEQEKLKEK